METLSVILLELMIDTL